MIKTVRLKPENIPDLLEFTIQDGFPFVVDEEMVKDYCTGEDPVNMCVQTYGVYDDEQLIAVMTARFSQRQDRAHLRRLHETRKTPSGLRYDAAGKDQRRCERIFPRRLSVL